MTVDVPGEETAKLLAVHISAATFQCAAIVSALVQRRLIEPADVIAWADLFAGGQRQAGLPSPDVAEGVAEALDRFADLIRSMATAPARAGTA